MHLPITCQLASLTGKRGSTRKPVGTRRHGFFLTAQGQGRGYAASRHTSPLVKSAKRPLTHIPCQRKITQPPDCKKPPGFLAGTPAPPDILLGKTRNVSAATSRFNAFPWWRPIMIPKNKGNVNRILKKSVEISQGSLPRFRSIYTKRSPPKAHLGRRGAYFTSNKPRLFTFCPKADIIYCHQCTKLRGRGKIRCPI